MHGNQSMPRILMRLKSLWKISRSMFRSFFRRRQGEVFQQEEVSSFVTQAKQVMNSQGHIHPSRLIPHRRTKQERLEVSICRSSNIAEAELWRICTKYFDSHSPRPAIGRGAAFASVVLAEGLHFDPNGIPYPQHADIIGWYDDPRLPDEELKHFWMDKAQKMAPHFKYSPRPVGK